MKKALIFSIVIYFVTGASVLLAQNQPKMGGTLIFGRGADSITMDPAAADDGESGKVVANIFEGLVRYKDDSTEVEPALAVSWETSREGREWIFHLRKDVVFHDGAPFNAQAVVFSFLRQIDPGHPFYRKELAYVGAVAKYLESVEALDDHTVRVSLKKPYAPLLYDLAMIADFYIVGPGAVKKSGDDFGRRPVGTGAFKLLEWKTGDRIILEKNKNYWGDPPYLDRVIFKSVKNNKSRLLALKTSAIHGMDGVDQTNVKEVERHKDLYLGKKIGLNIGYLAMNTEKKPFNMLKVRQAVNHAINKKKIIKFLYQGFAVPAKNPIPPAMWGYNENVVDYEYDPQKAKKLLAEAGYKNGFETTLWAMPVPRPYMPRPKKIAEFIKANLAAVGIKTRIISYDWKTYLDKTANGEHDMCLLGWIGDNGDPDNFIYVLLDKDSAVKPNAENVAFFKHDRLHNLLIEAQQIPDKQKRTSLYLEAQEIIHREAPWVPLAHAEQVVAFHKKVRNVALPPATHIRFHKVWME